MASINTRNKANANVLRLEVPAITLPNGASAEVKASNIPLNMIVKNIAVRTGDATNAITYTLKIYDDNSTIHCNVAGIADNAKTMLHSGLAAPDFPEFCINGTCQVGITPSGDPGGTGVSVNVDIFGV